MEIEKVIITKYDETYLLVETSRSVSREIRDKFSFDVPNAAFMPSYKNGIWDGRIYLYDINRNLIYSGLLHKLVEFCANLGYDVEVEKTLNDESLSIEEFIK